MSDASSLLKDNDLFSYPVDVKNLAERLGINVAFESLEEKVSGFLAINGDNSSIVVNSYHHEHRQRFTIAHELGHFVLHKGQHNLFLDTNLKFFRSNLDSEHLDQIENEANNYAGELLMPESLITEIIDIYNLDISDEYDFSKLAKKLKVSEKALTIRLMKLGYVL